MTTVRAHGTSYMVHDADARRVKNGDRHISTMQGTCFKALTHSGWVHGELFRAACKRAKGRSAQEVNGAHRGRGGRLFRKGIPPRKVHRECTERRKECDIKKDDRRIRRLVYILFRKDGYARIDLRERMICNQSGCGRASREPEDEGLDHRAEVDHCTQSQYTQSEVRFGRKEQRNTARDAEPVAIRHAYM